MCPSSKVSTHQTKGRCMLPSLYIITMSSTLSYVRVRKWASGLNTFWRLRSCVSIRPNIFKTNFFPHITYFTTIFSPTLGPFSIIVWNWIIVDIFSMIYSSPYCLNKPQFFLVIRIMWSIFSPLYLKLIHTICRLW